MQGRASELVARCLAAAHAGSDFPTVWLTILKNHPIVLGVPIQRLQGEGTMLEVRLITGQRIIFGPGTRDYALLSRPDGAAVI